MLNEAIACLEEGIVADSDMLDIGVIFGTGFAPFHGGPIQYARERGLEEYNDPSFEKLETEAWVEIQSSSRLAKI